MRRPAALALAACLTVSAAGCGGAPPLAAGAISMRHVGSRSYASEPTPDPVRAGKRSRELASAIERGAAVASRSLSGDGRLAAIAQAALAVPPDALGSPADFAEFYARHFGLSDTGLQLVLLPGEPADALADALSQAVFLRVARRPVSHYGAALEGNRFALVLSRRGVQLQSIPRRVEPGEPIELRGSAAGASGSVWVEYVDPSGRRHRMPVGRADALHVRVPTPEAGTYVIEVVAGAAGQHQILARTPVYVGVAPPRTMVRSRSRAAPQLGKVATALEKLIDGSRRAEGLTTLSSLPALTMLAVRHSVAMRDHAFVGYGDAELQRPIERVRRAGFSTGLVLDNIVRGVGAADAHRQFMQDAGLRRHVLSPELTHVGIGVVQGIGDELIVTTVFLRLTGWVDVVAGRKQLLRSINAARQARGVQPLLDDPDLAAVAQESAMGFFEPPFPAEQNVVAMANRHLDRLAIAYKRVAAVMATADDIAEVSALEPTLEPDATHVGIGLAQGDHPKAGARRLAAVIAIGYGR